jgi:hypothetical protein
MTLTDSDTGKVTTVNAFSGKGHYAAIPDGEYDIVQYKNERTKVRLEPIDSNYGDDRHAATGRSEFRFHHLGLGLNYGCISAASAADWSRASDAIFSTSTLTSVVNSKSFWGGTESVTSFGRLKVISGDWHDYKKNIFIVSFALLSTCAGLFLDYLIRGISAYIKTSHFSSPMVDDSFPYIVALVLLSGGLSVWTSTYVSEVFKKIAIGMLVGAMVGFIGLKFLHWIVVIFKAQQPTPTMPSQSTALRIYLFV